MINTNELKVYPNVHGHVTGDENRGGLRVGMVIENQDTQLAGTSGFPATVTHEADGWVRFYIYMVKPASSITGPEERWWQGPFTGLSEEIEEMTS